MGTQRFRFGVAAFEWNEYGILLPIWVQSIHVLCPCQAISGEVGGLHTPSPH